MDSRCLLSYSEERGVVCRKSREEFLGSGIQGRRNQGLTSQLKSLLLKQCTDRIGVFLD